MCTNTLEMQRTGPQRYLGHDGAVGRQLHSCRHRLHHHRLRRLHGSLRHLLHRHLLHHRRARIHHLRRCGWHHGHERRLLLRGRRHHRRDGWGLAFPGLHLSKLCAARHAQAWSAHQLARQARSSSNSKHGTRTSSFHVQQGSDLARASCRGSSRFCQQGCHALQACNFKHGCSRFKTSSKAQILRERCAEDHVGRPQSSHCFARVRAHSRASPRDCVHACVHLGMNSGTTAHSSANFVEADPS